LRTSLWVFYLNNQAPRKLKTEVDWTKKKNFGQVPRYLEKAKDRIQQEYEYLRQVHQDEEFARGQSKYPLPSSQIPNVQGRDRRVERCPQEEVGACQQGLPINYSYRITNRFGHEEKVRVS
jgi:hypothetical protein